MKSHASLNIVLAFTCLLAASLACNALIPLPSDDPATPAPDMNMSGFGDRPALPNDSGIEGVETFPLTSEDHNHVNSLPEPEGTIPPSFGPHYSAWQNCGIYDQPVEVGSALHSLEHGAVWLTYSPDLTTSQIEKLQNLVRGHDYVLMSPYPDQSVPVVLSAWTVQLVIESLPDDRIEQFINYYENGPQNPEPGAPCSGAVGNPLP